MLKNGSNKARWVLYPLSLVLVSGLCWAGFMYEPKPDVESIVGNAELFARTGLLDRADKEIETALRRDPENLYARLVQGYIAERRHDFSGALRIYDHALSLIDKPELRFDVELTRVDLLRRMERHDEVTAGLDALEEKWGERPEIWRIRGFAATAREKDEEALRHFRRYRELKPGDVDADCLVASALMQVGKYSEAQAILADVDEVEKSAWPLWSTLARFRLEAGDDEGAASALSTFAKLDNRASAKLRKDSFWAERMDEPEFRELFK
jgi:predicted Zn-dependent protease